MQENTVSQQTQSCPLSSMMGKEYAPLSPTHLANPYAFYARARQEEPVFYSPSLNMWIVTDYKDVATILKDHQRFSIAIKKLHVEKYTPEVIALLRTSPLSSVAFLSTIDPPAHTRLRTCASKALSQRLTSFKPRIRHIANQFIDSFESQEQIDFMAQFAHPYPLLVMSSLLGVPEADIPQLKVWVEQVFELFFANLSAEQQLRCAQGLVALQQYFYNLAESGQRTPDTFTSDLLGAIEAGQAPLSIAEAAAILWDAILGGFETTNRFLGNCLYRLLAERHHWQTILDDPHLIPALVEEALRLDTPAIGSLRITNEAVELGGKSIPEGALIQVLQASANRDEAIFPDAETFHPHRENVNRHVAFGYGTHFCLGSPLVRLEVQIALEQLSQRLPSLHLVPDQELSYTGNMVLRSLKQLLLEWKSTPSDR